MNKGEFSLYADEHISEEFIHHLNDVHHLKAHITEDKGKGRDDRFQFDMAIKKRSFLITKDVGKDKGFLNHQKFPFNRIRGILIIRGKDEYDFCDDIIMLASHRSLNNILHKKFVLSKEKIIVLSQNKDGSIKREVIGVNECPCDLEK